MTQKLAEPTWAPGNEKEANKCFQIYGEYVKKRRTVVSLAIDHLESAPHIKRRIKWAALALKEETGDSDVVKQMADTAIIDHIRKLDEIIEDYEEQAEKRRELLRSVAPGKSLTLPKLASLRDYTGLLREKRLALMDLARIRGVLDGLGNPGGGSPKINIILPGGLNRGEGTGSVVEIQEEEKKIPDA